MNDTHVRAAFDRLRSDVAEATEPATAYTEVTGAPSQRSRWVALAAAAIGVVVLLAVTALVARQFGADDIAQPPPAPSVGTTTPSTSIPSTTAVTASSTSTTTAAVPAPPAVASPTHRVANVAADDVLNVRHAPDASAPEMAELAPSYAGMRWTGEAATARDGGTWWRIELLDPVAVLPLNEPFHGPIMGWVNSAFLTPVSDGLPVDFDRLPCELGPGIGAVTVEPEGTGRFAADHILSLRHAADGACRRVVITLGSGFDREVDWELIATDLRPADHLPAGFVANEDRLTLEWSADTLEGARPEAMQVLTADGPILVTRDGFGTTSVVFTFPARLPSYRTLPDEGRIVIDYEAYGDPVANTADQLVVAAPPFVSDGTVWMEGWARPFEATLGIELISGAAPATGSFRGPGVLAEGPGSDTALTVPSWTEGWGFFRFQIEDLAGGDYEVFLFSGGGDEPTGIRVPFRVP